MNKIAVCSKEILKRRNFRINVSRKMTFAICDRESNLDESQEKRQFHRRDYD